MDSCASHALTSKQGININEANTHDFETMFNRLCTSLTKNDRYVESSCQLC